MSKNKSPFRGFTVEEIFSAEMDAYIIQVGSDLFNHKGNYVFSKKSAITFYNRILNNLINAMNKGSKEHKAKMEFYIRNLHILPLHIH